MRINKTTKLYFELIVFPVQFLIIKTVDLQYDVMLFFAVFGIPLRRSIIIIGVVQLVITILVTIFNTVQYADRSETYQGCSNNVGK